MPQPLFKSFFMGGFECSTHRRDDGVRLDLIEATHHDDLACSDYQALHRHGIRTVRDGIRWHLVESEPGRYDWSSARRQLHSAFDTGTQVIWDLWHYGWPDRLDFWDPQYPAHFAGFAGAFARFWWREGGAGSGKPLIICPVNEISFASWAGGDAGFFNPFGREQGEEMKVQLVRSAIAAIRAVWEVVPEARVVHCEPLIHVRARPEHPEDEAAARAYNAAQYAAFEMMAGRLRPELGGREEYLDIAGLNYYIHNQWYHPGGHGTLIEPSSPNYRPLRHLLADAHRRLGCPILLSETGIEDEARPHWLKLIGYEARHAMQMGVPLQGVCLYPICNHPGWADDRHCYNGMLDYPDECGQREPYQPLADELGRQQELTEVFLNLHAWNRREWREVAPEVPPLLDFSARQMEEMAEEPV